MHSSAANQTSEAILKFWENYINILKNKGIKSDLHRWYIKHLEGYIKYHTDHKLKDHTARNVYDYREVLGRNIQL